MLVPVMAYAIEWSKNGYSAPAYFRTAAQAAGVRVTQVCRPGGTRYGAKNSLHLRCLAMDIGVETTASQRAMLAARGVKCAYHKKGYFGATANHYHCSAGSTNATRSVARKDQKSRAKSIRSRNTGKAKAKSVRTRNKARVNSSSSFLNDWSDSANSVR